MATIEDVYSLLAENGAVVKFTSDTQLAPLRSMLSEILGKANTSLVEGNKKSEKTRSDAAKANDKNLKSMSKGLDKIEKAVKEQKGGLLSFFTSGNLWVNAGKMMLGAASMLIDYGKQYYGNLKKLSDAGVRIAEGFDKAYGAYAAVANMSHENFAKLLIQNKKFVARMNSASDSVSSGSRIIAEMASKLNGRFALDEEQTGTILEFFTNITNTMSRRKLTDSYLINQAELLGTTMKGLSAAVGMSIEQFKEKVKQDEQDLAERKIMRDSRSRGRYMLNKAAMGKDAALFLETGVPNEKVLQMMANPNQQAFLQKMMIENRKVNSDDKETYKKQLHQYAVEYKNGMTKFIDPVRENFDNQNALFLNLAGEWAKGQFGGMDFENISPEMFAKAIDESDMENQTVDGINMLNRSVDIIKDLLVYKIFKNSGTSVSKAMIAMNKGGDALKQFILGDDYDEFISEQYGVNFNKMKKRTDSMEDYEDKLKDKEEEFKESTVSIDKPYMQRLASKIYKYRNKIASKKAQNEEASYEILNNIINKGGKLKDYEEFRKAHPEYGMAEMVRFNDQYYTKQQIETFNKYKNVGGFKEMQRKVYNGGYDISGKLDKSIFPKNIKSEDFFKDQDYLRHLKEKNIPIIVELSPEAMEKLDSISKNTGNQAQAAKEAVEHVKSVESEGTRINAISPAMIPAGP